MISKILKIKLKMEERKIKRKQFAKLTPVFPDEKFELDFDTTSRIIDIFSPIGKGQRGLIVAQPKTGKTTILKSIANSIVKNHDEVHLIILLIDERPEEVTDIIRSVPKAEVVYSTFDKRASDHIKASNYVLNKSKKMVEEGKDVVVLMDSITRLARAYNEVEPSNGRTLSGGIGIASLHNPKRFFGAARNVEGGGSLTVIATALVDTGSKMDDIIFEEFKGTGNMELKLDRNLSERRIFPSIDIKQSGTRRDDLLLSPYLLPKVNVLRNLVCDMTPRESGEFIIDRISSTKDNDEFILTMNG